MILEYDVTFFGDAGRRLAHVFRDEVSDFCVDLYLGEDIIDTSFHITQEEADGAAMQFVWEKENGERKPVAGEECSTRQQRDSLQSFTLCSSFVSLDA